LPEVRDVGTIERCWYIFICCRLLSYTLQAQGDEVYTHPSRFVLRASVVGGVVVEYYISDKSLATMNLYED
jgi:hypothetical protein